MEPDEIMESALYVLQAGGSYKVAYDAFLGLYRTGSHREDAMSAMTQAFYEPNEEELRARYQKNCALLTKYPYLFRKDFPAFEDLPVRFSPYDDEQYLPFDRRTETFGVFAVPGRAVISRNFFRNLDKPVLATYVFPSMSWSISGTTCAEARTSPGKTTCTSTIRIGAISAPGCRYWI